MEGAGMRVTVLPAAERFVTRTELITSRHSFSYGPHYDPENTRFGALVAHNDDLLQPGGGFDDHPHRGIEIITFVVDGALRHRDDQGGSALLCPGFAQRLSSGRGVVHSEVNAADEPTRYLQMWLSPDVDAPPEYQVGDLSEAPAADGLMLIAADAAAPLRLRHAGARLLAGRLGVGEAATVPAAELAHLYVVSGVVELGGVRLSAGDAARVTGASDLEIAATIESLVLVWLLDAGPGVSGT